MTRFVSIFFVTSHFLCQNIPYCNMVQYEIGTCYGCCKCMYCGCDLSVEKCKCNKTVKPKRSNRTEKVPYTFSRNFEPNMLLCKKTFLQKRNILYSYNSNF